MQRFLATSLLLVLLVSQCFSADRYSKPGPIELTHDGRHWASQTLKKLTLEEKVGQLLSIRYFTDFQNFDGDAYKQFRDMMQKYHIGSVVLTVHAENGVLRKNPPLEVAAMSNQLQRDSKLPLLIAADLERGLSMRVSSVPVFPAAMAFGATGNSDYAKKFGEITAEESRAVGIHWDFFPVADVNSNPDNPIINTRSFGEDPASVGDLLAAFIHGARAHGMLTTAKHFPGHGDTSTDSHLGVAKVEGDKARLQSVELPPFKKAIDAGVDAVMVAHLSVPALDPDPNKVATISSQVVGSVLRSQLGFKNLIVTDALEMRGLTSLYPPVLRNPAGRAAVDAIKAGNDVILMPADLDGAFRGIVDAVKQGEITLARIDVSVRRVLEMKASLNLQKARLVDLERVSHEVGTTEALQFAQHVADEAVTLVRDNGQVIPVPRIPAAPAESETFSRSAPRSQQVVVIILTDSVRGTWGRAFESAFRARRADATVVYVDNDLAGPLTPGIMRAVQDASRVVVAAYVAPTAAKQVMVNGKLTNTVGLQESTGNLLRQVLDTASTKTAVIAMGNPYVVQSFSDIQTYLCTFSDVSSSELSAVKVVFGELQPRGRLPVTLPGVAPRGFSLHAIPAPGTAGSTGQPKMAK